MEPYLYTANNPVMFTDPTGMERNGIETELYNIDGKKIGEDAKGKDGNVSIIKDSNNAKQIEKNYKKNGVSSQDEVNSGVMTTKQELQESLNVIDRTIKNGGLREESSIIGSSGKVYDGETGTEPEFHTIDNGTVIMTAKATLYSLPSSETSGVSIHSHLTSLPVYNDQPFPVSASDPSQADNSNWTQNGLSRNIIVGRLGAGNISNIVRNGKGWKDKRDLGVAIYVGSKSRTPAVQLKTKAIQNILK